MTTHNQFKFLPGNPSDKTDFNTAQYLIFTADKILVEFIHEKPVLFFQRLPFNASEVRVSSEYLGLVNEKACFTVNIEEDLPTFENFEWVTLRSLITTVEKELFLMLSKARQINFWAENNRFCGKCGTPTESVPSEKAKSCPKCNAIFYPNIYPAIIVAIEKEGKILLAHAKRFKENFYSVLAGFLEVGESFEDCLRREVYEEVGIQVKNINYFGSQAWAFPSSMMVGFTAEWDSGEIQVDDDEISHADWYAPDELPLTPGEYSIAGQLISWFVHKHKKEA
ncbi:NAD(+) diphosphatase [Flexithrix dorotheae]|uniref:NAD(+) diphosphatase n=1 Tax=Flexithrix dorotheae TaxID=70993 RepID=UPI00037995FC|nr:NAD(+) diphosphatase [Flexithrix dorotheae]